MLQRRANNWENMFNPDNGLLNPRTSSGQLVPGITPTLNDLTTQSELYYVEGDPYQYMWDTNRDYSALFSLLGGDSKVRPRRWPSTSPSPTATARTPRSATVSAWASSTRPTTRATRRAPSCREQHS